MDAGVMDYIVEMVLKKLQSDNVFMTEKALVVLEGNVEELSVLEDIKYGKNYDLSLLVLQTAATHEVYEKYGKVIYIETLSVDIDKLLAEFCTVILPNPSLKTISRLAHIIIDGVLPELVFQALEQDKRILVNGFANNKRLQRLSSPLRSEAEQLMKKLAKYGIDELNTLPHRYNAEFPKRQMNKVLTLRDIEEVSAKGSELIIGSNAILTPLAADYIRENKIILKRLG